MPHVYANSLLKQLQFCKEKASRISSSLCWQDLIGVLSIIIYAVVSIDAIFAVQTGITTHDSNQMLGMARGERILSTNDNPFFVLYLKLVLEVFGEQGIIYMHYLVGAITSLTLVWVFGRKNILSWSGFWLLSMPGYVFFNMMVWKDVLFLYLATLSIALIIKSDRDILNSRNLYIVITILLTAVCLVRLNGYVVASIIVVSFLVNKKNIKYKILSLIFMFMLAVGTTSVVESVFQVIQSKGKTTKDLAVRMVENDYLYYMFCIAHEDVAGLKDQRNKVYTGLPSYCKNSYVLDAARGTLSDVERNKIYDASLELFLKRPVLWLSVKYKELFQYHDIRSAYVFPTDVSRLKFFNEDSKHYMRTMLWSPQHAGLITRIIFSPTWIFVLLLYVVGREILIKFGARKEDDLQRSILVPVSLISIVFYFSLTIPFMTNDTRYFLPAIFISMYIFATTLGKDLMLLLPMVKSAYRKQHETKAL